MEKLFLAIWRLLVFISISLTFIYIILRIYKVADFLLVKQKKKNSKIIAAIFFSILIMATSKYPLNLVAGSAIVNVRDSIAIFASIIAGPIVGIVVGLVGGIYRISLGGWTALPCGLAVISISIIAAYLTKYKNYRIGEMTKRKILNISILIFVWEIMHTMVYCTLLGAKPFPEAFMLMARNSVIPMVVTNVIAITMFLLISRDAVIRANNMEKVKNYTKELEEKVQERTFNLDKEFQTSEQQRIATLNIFNDLNKATKDLKSENAERKQTEILLRESEENLRTLFNAMTDVVFEMNYEGRYINIAPTSPELLYKISENIIGKTLHEIFPKPEADNFLKFIQKSLDENKTTTIEYPLRIRDKIIWFEGKATPKTKNSVLFIARDITKSKKAQAELKAYREHLEDLVTERTKELKEIQKKMIRQERLAVLGQLAGGVGHELRNPLGVIGNSIYFLNMKLKHPEEKVEKHLGILRREIARADNLISDLLDFSRVREVSLRETDLNKLIKNAIQEIKIPENVVLEMDLDEKLPKIQLDSERMRRVFLNLISNAFQSISKKGEVKIKTGSSNGFTEIRFMDNGIGIPPENLTKIFEPLFTTRAKGIGLGLSIVKNIIDNHKGEIDVESKVGLGTTFTIKLAL